MRAFQSLAVVANFLDSADLTIHKTHLDAVRVSRRVRQNIPDNAECSSARALILLQDDFDCNARFYIFPVLTIHKLCTEKFIISV